MIDIYPSASDLKLLRRQRKVEHQQHESIYKQLRQLRRQLDNCDVADESQLQQQIEILKLQLQ